VVRVEAQQGWTGRPYQARLARLKESKVLRMVLDTSGISGGHAMLSEAQARTEDEVCRKYRVEARRRLRYMRQ
jgi:hypothetical protein